MPVRSAVRAVLAIAVLSLGPVPAAFAHGHAETHEGHVDEDSAVHDVAAEPALAARTRAATAADASVAAAAVTGNEHEVGSWGPVVDWPVVAIHTALLPNGKVLAYDSVGDKTVESYPVHDFTRATVWDPQSGTHTPATVNTGHNVFCSGLAHLIDGTLFLAGGNLNAQLDGIVQTHTFDHTTNTWSLGPNMAAGRWYPTVTPLRNGEMLITEGGPDMPEVRTTAGTLRALSTASLNLPLYPWLDVAPDGRAFYSGPDQTMRSLNTDGTGAWQSLGARDSINRSYGGHALYDVGKLLVAGGGGSSRDARVIDINGAAPQVTATSPLVTGRRQHNLTVLADGSVLATGGNSSGASLVDLANGVYTAERWSPSTGAWTTLAAEAVTRQYHSTALLLPDGRVLSAGGGICMTCDAVGYLAKNAQVFTPPYLFKRDGSGTLAPRPTIADAPAAATYGVPFEVATPNAASIRKAALVRLGAVTHSVNMEQRYVPLSYTASGGALTVTAPANANIAPPGVYMLFLVDAEGVPSVARMLRLTDKRAPAVTITQPANGTTFTAPATVPIAASASDVDGTIAKVEFFNGSAKLGEDSTAPYSFNWSGVTAGTYTLTARATDDAGIQTRSAPVTITVTTGNTPPTAAITSPADGAVFPWHATINITASAADSDGRVVRVEFFRADGTVKLGEDTTAPYSHAWKNVRSGSHTLTVRAHDDRGAATTSPPVRITVRPR